MRRDDKSLDHLRFEHIALPYCAKKGNCITQMAYAKAVIITPEMEYDTYPTFSQGEAQCVDALFRNGLEYLHLRKPEADAHAYETFLKQVESQYYPRIVLHDHFELAEQYGLKGVHLNQRNPYPPEKWEGHISRSCHSLEDFVSLESAVEND